MDIVSGIGDKMRHGKGPCTDGLWMTRFLLQVRRMTDSSANMCESFDNSDNPLYLNLHFSTKHWQK